MPSARTGQLVDYCSHLKLSGLVMVEHRHAGSWLGKLCFPLEVQWVFLEINCPMASSKWSPPPHKGREVVEWPPGRLRETSVVFLFSNLWLPDQGLGTWLGESQACSPKVVESMCSWTLPSGCPMAFWQEGPRQGVSENPVVTLRGDAGVSSLAGQHLHWLCCSLGWPASRLFSGKSHRGDRPPAHKKCGLYFFLI